MKNSIGWGRPSSDMKARDWVRAIFCAVVAAPGTERREAGGAPPDATNSENGQKDVMMKVFREARTIVELIFSFTGGDLDIDKVDLEFLFGLDADEKGRSTSGGDDLVREVGRLEDKGKRSFL